MPKPPLALASILILPSPDVASLGFHPWKAPLTVRHPKRCRVRNARPYRRARCFALAAKASRLPEQLPRGLACPSLDPYLLRSRLIPLHSKRAASSSCVAFKCYHSDE